MHSVSLHIHLPFSWWQNQDPVYGVRLEKPDPRIVNSYLNCLGREIAGMKEDYEDCQVDSIRFLGGYLGLLDSDDFERLLHIIHRAFHTKDACPITGVLFPGSLDMDRLSVYRNHHVTPLMFEVPSLSYNECRAMHLPIATQALSQTQYLLQNFHVDEWGLMMPVGIPGRTKTTWDFILGQIYHFHPTYIRFFSIDSSVMESDAFTDICLDLTEHGYTREGEFFSLTGTVPAILLPHDPDREYIGIGIGSESRIDGFNVKNTCDWKTYQSLAYDHRKLMISAAETAH